MELTRSTSASFGASFHVIWPPRSNGRYRRRRPRISRRLPAPSVQQALTLRKRQISCRAASRDVEPHAPRDSGTRFLQSHFPSRWISGAPVENAARATWNPGYTNFQSVKRYGLTHVTVCSMELRSPGAVFATPDSRVALSSVRPLPKGRGTSSSELVLPEIPELLPKFWRRFPCPLQNGSSPHPIPRLPGPSMRVTRKERKEREASAAQLTPSRILSPMRKLEAFSS